jgi:hypothetical protein
METVQVTMTDGVKDYLQKQASKRGLGSPGELLQSILDELDKNVKDRKELEAGLLEAIRGPDVVADAAFWAERRRKILEKHPEIRIERVVYGARDLPRALKEQA